jgi:hypothetical protein
MVDTPILEYFALFSMDTISETHRKALEKEGY